MNLLIVGDSLAFPRAHKQQSVSDSWPPILAKLSAGYVWNRSVPGATSEEVRKALRKLNVYCSGIPDNFDAIFIQVGIVDATPRKFSKAAHKILKKIPFFESYIRGLLNAVKGLIGIKPEPWVTEKQFALNIDSILLMASRMTKTIVLVAIAPPRHYLPGNAQGVSDSVKRFNERLMLAAESDGLAAHVYFLDPWSALAPIEADTMLLPDGHHLTKEGHSFLADEANKVLSVMLSRKAASDEAVSGIKSGGY